MILWIDAQISPQIASWISDNYGVDCIAVRDLGLIRAEDRQIFMKAKEANAIIITKDSDFVNLQQQYEIPPKIIFLTCGNTSNQKLKEIFKETLSKAISLLESGEALVEISY